jgi:hypothetical protein
VLDGVVYKAGYAPMVIRLVAMQAIREDALGGVNSYLMAAKQDRALYESRFSLITFSSESVDTIRSNQIMEEVKPIGSDEYRCAGWTPLYEAIGRGIRILDEADTAAAGDLKRAQDEAALTPEERSALTGKE